eukprot:COSAG06_NODE_1865_length_8193_cov_5.395355_1_plen_170_part_00
MLHERAAWLDAVGAAGHAGADSAGAGPQGVLACTFKGAAPGVNAPVRGVVVELGRVGLAEQLDVRAAALRGLGVLEGVLDHEVGALVREGVGLRREEVVAHVLGGHDALGGSLLAAVVVAGGVLPRTELLVTGSAGDPAALPVAVEGPARSRVHKSESGRAGRDTGATR